VIGGTQPRDLLIRIPTDAVLLGKFTIQRSP
jgi:hypothetical protein